MFGGCCILLAGPTISYSLLVRFAQVARAAEGAYGPVGSFRAMPAEILPARIASSMMGLVNATCDRGACLAPLIAGYLNKKTGNFLVGSTYLGLITVVAAGHACF
jgi:hypothetical protein